MSNLLKKKDLTNRGPQIAPTKSFTLDEVEVKSQEVNNIEKTEQPEVKVEPVTAPKKPGRPKTVQDGQVSSVRIMKGTRNKLNALVQMGKAENADILIDYLIELYINGNLSDDEKRVYSIFKETFDKK